MVTVDLVQRQPQHQPPLGPCPCQRLAYLLKIGAGGTFGYNARDRRGGENSGSGAGRELGFGIIKKCIS